MKKSNGRGGALHPIVRSLTKHYPARRLAPQFSALMGVLIPSSERRWMVIDACGRAPLLELDLTHRHTTQDLELLPKSLGQLAG